MSGTSTWWRRVPVDLVAFAAIALVILLPCSYSLRRSVSLADASWYVHFGTRVLHGDVPYRDFVFPRGPLPLYVDAAFQAAFGASYRASAYAAALLAVIRIFLVWALARRLVDLRVATLLATFCAFDPLFALPYHADASYLRVLVALGGLALVRGSGTTERWPHAWFAVAGVALAATALVQPAVTLVLAILTSVLVATIVKRRDGITARAFALLSAGAGVTLAASLVVLAAIGALAPALHQLVLTAPSATILDSTIDAVSGGAFVGPHGWWGGLLLVLALPGAVVAATLYLASRDDDLEPATIALVAVPFGCLYVLFVRYGQLDLLLDLPRTALIAVITLAVASPGKLRSWLGLEPLIALALAAIPLATDAAAQLASTGRGPGDSAALVLGVILCTLASNRITSHAKGWLCGALALSAALHVGLALHRAAPVFAGTSQPGPSAPTVSSKRTALRGMRMSPARRQAIDWLARQIPAHHSCFVQGNLPGLYAVLGCSNPTRADVAAVDLITPADLAGARGVLRDHPPEYVLVHELHTPREILELLAHYDTLGTVATAVGPAHAATLATEPDRLDLVQVFRRREAAR